MKVLQLIDTLEAGGAERVAVNYANGLLNYIEGSYLCTTRAEGLLKKSLKKGVGYLFLEKTSTIDFKAIRSLNKYVKKNDITIIHAHSSSYFLASIIKFLNPKLKLVWHDHYGKSEFLNQRPKGILKLCSRFFNHVFSVNTKLEHWATQNLKTKSVSYLPNYAVKGSQELTTKLNGELGRRIVCLANLRPQKDHLNLLKAFRDIIKTKPEWSLHLVGQDFKDEYSNSVLGFIKQNDLSDSVFMYGSCPDVSTILEQCNIGVLASKSEGLPLALLEYGLAGLPVVTTNVGDCKMVISNESHGQLVVSEDISALKKALLTYISEPEKAKLAGQRLKEKVEHQFSEQSTLHTIISIYKTL